jgi:hypothetical protein
MASLEHADLPSSDEEDDDYDPSADPTGEKEDRPGAGAGAAAGGSGGGQHKGSKRRCVWVAAKLACVALVVCVILLQA